MDRETVALRVDRDGTVLRTVGGAEPAVFFARAMKGDFYHSGVRMQHPAEVSTAARIRVHPVKIARVRSLALASRHDHAAHLPMDAEELPVDL